MGLQKKLTRHGNSYALVIDKALIELLGLDPEIALEITTDGKNLIISPATPQRKNLFNEKLEKINQKYSQALKKLAQ